MEIDINKILNRLTNEIALMVKENAILQIKLEEMQAVIDKQKNLIDAYKDKEKIEKVDENEH